MLDKNIKKRWVAELRVEGLKQCRSRLHSNSDGVDAFCCLGVLTKMLMPELGLRAETSNSSVSYNGATHLPPLEVSILSLGKSSYFDASEMYVTIDGKNRGLASHNDAGKTFEQIANAIEEQL